MNGLLLTNVVSGGGWAGQLAVPDNSARPLRFRATSGSGVSSMVYACEAVSYGASV